MSLKNILTQLVGLGDTKKQETPIPVKDRWEEFQTVNGTTGHRISLNNITEQEKNELLNNLDQNGICYTYKRASASTKKVNAGDLTLRVSGEKDVSALRMKYFGYDSPDPVERYIDEDENGHSIPVEVRVFKYPAEGQKPSQAQKARIAVIKNQNTGR